MGLFSVGLLWKERFAAEGLVAAVKLELEDAFKHPASAPLPFPAVAEASGPLNGARQIHYRRNEQTRRSFAWSGLINTLTRKCSAAVKWV